MPSLMRPMNRYWAGAAESPENRRQEKPGRGLKSASRPPRGHGDATDRVLQNTTDVNVANIGKD